MFLSDDRLAAFQVPAIKIATKLLAWWELPLKNCIREEGTKS
jgi:hypothetical protein